MRNKFTELINKGVARFDYKPVGPETPSMCPICRAYNNLWGVITDTHMSEVDGRLIITGTLLDTPKKWEALLYCSNWGGVTFRSSGYESLANMFYMHRMTWKPISYNSQAAIEIIPLPEDVAVASANVSAYTTSESKFPQPIARLMDVCDLQECLNERTLYNITEAMNASKNIPGESWYCNETGIGGFINGVHIMLEMSFESGTKVVDKALSDALEAEQLGDLYLRQFPSYFVVDSDDKQWRAVLRKNHFNKIKVKSLNEISPEDWVYHIKNIINSIS